MRCLVDDGLLVKHLALSIPVEDFPSGTLFRLQVTREQLLLRLLPSEPAAVATAAATVAAAPKLHVQKKSRTAAPRRLDSLTLT